MKQEKVISLYGGIFLTSFSIIVFEISLTRIFSVTLWYHFAYFAVSLALFGLGAGGLVAFFCQSFFSNRFPYILKHLASLQFLSMVCSLLFVLNKHFALLEDDLMVVFSEYALILSFLLKLTVTYVICAIPFFLGGIILALVIQNYVEHTPKIYFLDLLGSGVGCLGFVFAITLVSGPAVVIITALLALAASLCFSKAGNKGAFTLRMLITGLLASTLYWLNISTDMFSIQHTKAYRERDDVLLEKWSPLARITVYPKIFWVDNPEDPFGWGMSRKFEPEKPIEQLWIEQDACAGTPITHYTGDIAELEFLKYDITSFGYHVRSQIDNVFIIGPGGGRDVLTALAFKVPDIHACDINPVIVNLVKDRFNTFAGNIYNLPDVNVAIAEGRSYIRNQKELFDIIQISLIDSWAATAAGAFSLAENNLYTVEAFLDYFDRLHENGILSITRFLFTPRNQSLRVAIIARKALEVRGIERPESHIAVISTDEKWGLATVLMKKTAFTQAEIEKIHEAAQELDFKILYRPGHEGDTDFVKALTMKPLKAFLMDTYYDLSPSTDDRPFFFQMLHFLQAFDLVSGKGIAGQTVNYFAPLVLLVLLVLSSVLVVIFYVSPLILSRKVERLPRLWGIYFILLGVGFMFVEIPLLQKGSLYLGHPTYSLTIVLFSMLTFAGCGSYWSRKINETNLLPTIRRYLLVIVFLIGILTVTSEWLFRQTIGFPLIIKIIVFVLLVGITAFFMGTAFPSGIRLVSRVHKQSIPWVWALNGGASVMGSVLAMTVAMSFGYIQTFILGGVCYLAVFLVAHRQN